MEMVPGARRCGGMIFPKALYLYASLRKDCPFRALFSIDLNDFSVTG
jgi:hypothetical protein